METHTIFEDELRELGDGLLPHEMGEQAVEEFIDGVISVFEKRVISEIAKMEVSVDYGYIAQQVRKVLQDNKKQLVTETSLVLTVMALAMVDGDPLFITFRKGLAHLTKLVVEQYRPTNITSEALGLAIGDALKKAAAEEESEEIIEKPVMRKPQKRRITVFNPIGGNA